MRIKNPVLRWVARIFLFLGILVVLLLAFIRSPWGQDLIVSRVIDHVKGKTGTEVALDRLFIDFSGNLVLENLYLEDKVGDTLLYSRELRARLGLTPLLFGNELNIASAEWTTVRANISREAGREDFNFSFLVDALTPAPSPDQPLSEPMKFTLGSADLADIRLQYRDGQTGVQSNIRLGELTLDARTTDLDNMVFELDEVEWKDSRIVLILEKEPPAADSAAVPLPVIRMDRLSVTNVTAHYRSVPDSIRMAVDIGTLAVDEPDARLPENDFRLTRLALRDSRFDLNVPATDAADGGAPRERTGAEMGDTFSWPAWVLRAEEIALENNQVRYTAGQPGGRQPGFDPADIRISGLDLMARNLEYSPKDLHLDLRRLAFRERGSLAVQNLSFETDLTEDRWRINNFSLETPESAISGELQLEYPSFRAFLKAPEEVTVDMRLPSIRLALQELMAIAPALRENTYVNTLAAKPVTGELVASGSLDSLRLQTADLAWGAQTAVEARGYLQDVNRVESLYFNIDSLRASTTEADISAFLDESQPGIALPETLSVAGQASGSLTGLEGEVRVTAPYGSLRIDGMFRNEGGLRFDGEVVADSLQLDSLLQDQQFGNIAFRMDLEGSGEDLGSLDATMNADITHFVFRDYDLSGIALAGEMVNGRGDLQMDFKDRNLNVEAIAEIRLDSERPGINARLNLIGADLQALGLTRDDIRAGMEVRADFTGTPGDFNLQGQIENAIAVHENDQYQMGRLDLTAHSDTVRTDLSVSSEFLNGELRSNTSVAGFRSALTRQFREYFEAAPDTLGQRDTIRVDMDFTVDPTPFWTEVFLREFTRLEPMRIQADFDAAARTFTSTLDIPSLEYRGSAVDSVFVHAEGSASDLTFTAGVGGLRADPVHIRQTFLTGNLGQNELQLDLRSLDGKDSVLHIRSALQLSRDTTFIHILPQDLILNGNPWTIPEDNRIVIGREMLRFENLELTRGGQRLTIGNRFEGITDTHIGLAFEAFRLQSFISVLNPDEKLASGRVNGRFVIENLFDGPGMVAGFEISEFGLLDNPLGTLSFTGSSEGRENYDFDLGLKGPRADVDVTGEYRAAATGAAMQLNLDINRIDFRVIEGFSRGFLRDSEGTVSGRIALGGTTAEPRYDGFIEFADTRFEASPYNTRFAISDERVRLDTDGLYMDNFEIADENGHTLVLDGSVLTEDLPDPGFDLTLRAEEFMVLNASEADNEDLYGKASVDADIALQGSLKYPEIDGRLRMRPVTEVTYVVPESQLAVQEREGVVIFVNRENPDAILTRNEQEEVAAAPGGMDVDLILAIAEDSEFHIILDERSGDNLKVSGAGELNLSIDPNGRTQLTGRYELQSGHYETSLYNLVSRRFEINPGGTVTWQGDPMDAKLDVRATYRVETSAAPLMATVTSGQDLGAAGQYRQELPFLVYLDVEGDILEPELSFDLDMPEDEQGTLGGAVYSRVQQLNQQEAQLNKQVFSLLALNRFYPDPGSDGSTGGTAALARDNVNKVLSGELNALSGRIFGESGFEVDFDLDSFTDYRGETPQDRTQLNINASKRLLDDRLIVTAGSAVDVEGSAQPGQEETPIIGNVSLEYLLTENGVFRLRGFRRTEYENIIDGQFIVTGIALIFNREFNAFSELFRPIGGPEKEDGETPGNEEKDDPDD